MRSCEINHLQAAGTALEGELPSNAETEVVDVGLPLTNISELSPEVPPEMDAPAEPPSAPAPEKSDRQKIIGVDLLSIGV